MELDYNRVKNIIDNNEGVSLIAGVINATGKILYWKDEIGMDIGEYALVENMNGYDLIKVVGVVVTTKKDASKFSKTKYENMKNVIKEIKI